MNKLETIAKINVPIMCCRRGDFANLYRGFSTEWNSHNGVSPVKTPSTIGFVLISLLPSLSKIFSLKNLLNPF